jgi:hypothetical protein
LNSMIPPFDVITLIAALESVMVPTKQFPMLEFQNYIW